MGTFTWPPAGTATWPLTAGPTTGDRVVPCSWRKTPQPGPMPLADDNQEDRVRHDGDSTPGPGGRHGPLTGNPPVTEANANGRSHLCQSRRHSLRGLGAQIGRPRAVRLSDRALRGTVGSAIWRWSLTPILTTVLTQRDAIPEHEQHRPLICCPRQDLNQPAGSPPGSRQTQPQPGSLNSAATACMSCENTSSCQFAR